ncbi:MAG: hypothetical protein GY882_03370 [Actinomycetia bacterium]|nr:hypothetical protein [Actinomycetes bacterium]MCP4845231.1 hypothetical protein [Actinomycetes bacterium]
MAVIHSTRRPHVPQSSERFYVRVVTPEGSPQFLDATAYIGREMPFRSPQATVAMRTHDDVITFSLMHVTKRVAKNLTGNTVQLPGGALKRLRMRAREIEVNPGQVVLEIAASEESPASLHTLDMDVAADGTVALTLADHIDGDEQIMLPSFGAAKMSVYAYSQAAKRTVAVSFIGHFGKPGSVETVVRSASKILNSIAGLDVFRALTGIEAVDVPMPPGNWVDQSSSLLRREAGDAAAEVKFYLFSEQLEHVAAGAGTVEVNLDVANAATGQLQVGVEPGAELADAWPAFADLARKAVNEQIRLQMGAEFITEIALDIALGEVDVEIVARLREAIAAIGGLDLTPSKYRVHG